MKIENPYVFLSSEGKLMMMTVEVPKEPKAKMSELDANCHPEYGYQLQYEWKLYDCVLSSAKSSAVEVWNGTETQASILNKFAECKVGTLYQLTGYVGEVKEDRIETYSEMCGCVDTSVYYRKYALISPLESKPKWWDKTKDGDFEKWRGEEMKEEDQEELWAQVQNKVVAELFIKSPRLTIEELSNQYLITHKIK